MSALPVRVDPWGTLHAVPEHGTTFGIRGVLHDRDRQIVRGWQGRRSDRFRLRTNATSPGPTAPI